MKGWPNGSSAAIAKNRRLRARIIELEAEQAITHGTLEQRAPDEATTIVHDVKPSAPPHNE